MSAEPVAEPLVGFRHWGCKRGGLYSGIFVAGRFVPNPALRLIAPRVGLMPWPTDHERVAKCFRGALASTIRIGSCLYALKTDLALPPPQRSE